MISSLRMYEFPEMQGALNNYWNLIHNELSEFWNSIHHVSLDTDT